MLTVVNRNVDYMKNLVIKTIELAKLNSPDVEFNFEDINLLDEMNKVVDANEPLFDEKQIKIINNVSENILISADKIRFEELFINLLNNSVKYTDGSGLITINAKTDNNFVTVSF